MGNGALAVILATFAQANDKPQKSHNLPCGIREHQHTLRDLVCLDDTFWRASDAPVLFLRMLLFVAVQGPRNSRASPEALIAAWTRPFVIEGTTRSIRGVRGALRW